MPDQGDPSGYLEDEIVGETELLVDYGACILGHRCAQRSKQQGSDLEPPGTRRPIAVSSSRRCVIGSSTRRDTRGVVSARVLFDGSNGMLVNRRIRLRDQERAPVASDLKRCMREKARRVEQTFSLTADVAEAHREVPVDRRDWHLLGCQVEAEGDVFIDTVGTFGLASASYCW